MCRGLFAPRLRFSVVPNTRGSGQLQPDHLSADRDMAGTATAETKRRNPHPENVFHDFKEIRAPSLEQTNWHPQPEKRRGEQRCDPILLAARPRLKSVRFFSSRTSDVACNKWTKQATRCSLLDNLRHAFGAARPARGSHVRRLRTLSWDPRKRTRKSGFP